MNLVHYYHPKEVQVARLSFAAAALFVVLLAALHIVKPELDPSWRFISEYAIGDKGWIMDVAFLSLAVSFIALFVAIRSQVRTTAGRVGLAMLLISAAGLAMAAMFTTDPITAGKEAGTTHGTLHNLGGALGLGMPIGALLVSWNLARNPRWSAARRSLLGTAGLALVASVVFIVVLAVMVPSDGRYGPEVLVGWPGRFEILANSAWLMTVAWWAGELRTGAATRENTP